MAVHEFDWYDADGELTVGFETIHGVEFVALELQPRGAATAPLTAEVARAVAHDLTVHADALKRRQANPQLLTAEPARLTEVIRQAAQRLRELRHEMLSEGNLGTALDRKTAELAAARLAGIEDSLALSGPPAGEPAGTVPVRFGGPHGPVTGEAQVTKTGEGLVAQFTPQVPGTYHVDPAGPVRHTHPHEHPGDFGPRTHEHQHVHEAGTDSHQHGHAL